MELKTAEQGSKPQVDIKVLKLDKYRNQKAPAGHKYYQVRAVVRGKKCQLTELVDVSDFKFDIQDLLIKGKLIKEFVDKFKVEE